MARELLTPGAARPLGRVQPRVRAPRARRPAARAAPVALLHAVADDRLRALARSLHRVADYDSVNWWIGTTGRRRRSVSVMAPEPEPTVETVKDFWEGHVNNEYYTDAAAGVGRVLPGDRGAPVRDALPPGRALSVPRREPGQAARSRLRDRGGQHPAGEGRLRRHRGRPHRERARRWRESSPRTRACRSTSGAPTRRTSTSPTRPSTSCTRSACCTTRRTSRRRSARCAAC